MPASPVPVVAALDLPLARARHDRAAERRDRAGLLPSLYADAATRVLLVHGDRLSVADAGGRARLAWRGPAGLPAPADPAPTPPPRPDAADDPADVARDTPREQEPPLWLYLGEHDGVAYVALALPQTDAALATLDVVPGWATLRDLDHLDDLEQGLATEAVALANWHAVHAFCPRCGAPAQVRAAGWVRWCPVEDRELYPRTDPAVIMAVVDDDERLLLGHAAHWPAHRFSTLAGFVEPGESLEQAVRREVAEEVGLSVCDGRDDVVYRGSQAWPFPASLMLGFRARVAGTAADPAPDGVELTQARWFTRAELSERVRTGEVVLPTRLSIARALIEEWFGASLPGA
ncbi:NAD(+) diphosphatase [Xylanimonas allomyrinae]|uniref:NAD(+) diphosphatase n=1 Tax=Xylanimonas allomyrinae TaxID=2509459 RepID=UPI001FEA6A78|nr:NAD(+) diphosphatase [Xylanimonas allomyrinae]